jgi:hypothetical protein
VNWRRVGNPDPAAGTHTTNKVSRRACRTCSEPVPIGFGRPRLYCSLDCRNEMYRRCRELDDLEAQVEQSRVRLRDGYAPGRYFWRGHLAFLEHKAAELRARIPEEMQ